MSALTAGAHRAHPLPQGETAALTAAHRSARQGLHAQARARGAGVRLSIRVALTAGLLAVLVSLPVLWLSSDDRPWVVISATVMAAAGILTLAITASVFWTGKR